MEKYCAGHSTLTFQLNYKNVLKDFKMFLLKNTNNKTLN